MNTSVKEEREIRKEKDESPETDFAGSEGVDQISEVVKDYQTYLIDREDKRERGVIVQVPTGFTSLDTLTHSGFENGSLVVLAARPSVGKTSMMLHMAKVVAETELASLVISLEMTNRQLAHRLLYSTGKIAPEDMTGKVDWDRYKKAAYCFEGKKLFLNDTANSVEKIASLIVSEHRRGRCDIAFIDYLGLIETERGQNRAYEIAEVTKRLKQVAKENDIPIVLLCQLNRDTAKKPKSPNLHDLRDSGAIEQDADIVLMLERVTEKDKTTSLKVWVRKNRMGKAGDICIKVKPNDTYTVFDEDWEYNEWVERNVSNSLQNATVHKRGKA